MDGNIDLFTLIALIVAVFAIFKLRSVLGRRTGDEETRIERYRSQREAAEASVSDDNVVSLPRREGDEQTTAVAPEIARAEAEERIKAFAGSNSALAAGLTEIVKNDPAFDPENFLNGARQAYEMIVTAFAEGNRRMLKDLLSPDVFDGFVGAIQDREGRGEQVDQSFVGIDKATILEADMKEGLANITVRFVSQLISATRDAAGEVVSGDPQRIKEVTDIWTFSRDLSTARARLNPNWRLVATQASN